MLALLSWRSNLLTHLFAGCLLVRHDMRAPILRVRRMFDIWLACQVSDKRPAAWLDKRELSSQHTVITFVRIDPFKFKWINLVGILHLTSNVHQVGNFVQESFSVLEQLSAAGISTEIAGFLTGTKYQIETEKTIETTCWNNFGTNGCSLKLASCLHD